MGHEIGITLEDTHIGTKIFTLETWYDKTINKWSMVPFVFLYYGYYTMFYEDSQPCHEDMRHTMVLYSHLEYASTYILCVRVLP